MDADEWKQVSDAFAKCLQLSDNERERFLRAIAESDSRMARELRELLKFEEGKAIIEQSTLDQLPPVLENTTRTTESPLVSDACHQERSSNRGRPPSVTHCNPKPTHFDWLRTQTVSFWILQACSVIAFAALVYTVVLLSHYGNLTDAWGWDAVMRGARWNISAVDPGAPAAGKLEPGDEVLSINGDTRLEGTGLIADVTSVPPGVSYRIDVLRQGIRRQYTLTKRLTRNTRGRGSIIAYLLVSGSFLVVAVLIGFLKPDTRLTQIAYAALMCEALVLLRVLLSPYDEFLRGASFLSYQGLAFLDGPHFALAYHCYWKMFDRAPKPSVWKYGLYLLYPWAIIVALFRALLLSRAHIQGLSGEMLDWNSASDGLFYVIAPVSLCLVIARNYFRVEDPDRRRARWIAFGSLVGIVPYAVVHSSGAILDASGMPAWGRSEAYRILITFSIVFAAAIPLTTGYAMLKHRLFDIQFVIRRGVQYLLARSVLQLVLALPPLSLAYALITNAHRTVADLILHTKLVIVLLVLIAVVLRYRDVVGRWLDRRFFREKYREEHLLLSLIDSVKTLHSQSDVAHRVGSDLTASLHSESVYIFYQDLQQRSFTTMFCSDQSASALVVAETTPLVAALKASEQPQNLSSIRQHLIGSDDWRWLDRLGIDLLVPMNGSDGRLVGFLLLGRKMSDEPYSSQDRRLLAALSNQMAIVYENILLQRRLGHQVRIARDMQARADGQGVRWLRECPNCGRCLDTDASRCPDDGTELVFSVPVTRTLDDRYRLERLIGKGGMGAVYLASDLRLNRPVAVKIVAPANMSDPIALRRFEREAHAAARLAHPNVIATYDVGIVDGAAAYLVMEYVAGITLRSAMGNLPVNPPLAALWFDQILEGVKEAHRIGVIHRDLKPENILVAGEPRQKPQIKILDFGTARTAFSDAPESTLLTVPGTILGTLNYMSPEQLTAQPATERSDLFSIGVMIFEVLTGRLPFAGRTYAERLASMLRGPFYSDSQSSFDERLRRALEKCLDNDPARRFTSAEEMQHAIVPLIGHCRSAAAQGQAN